MKCNCKFSLWIRLSGDEYIIDVSSPNHNHPPSISATGHPCITSLKEHEKENVIRKSELGIPPRTILAELRQDDSHATAKGIYNCLATHRKLQLGGQTQICALLRLLRGEADDYFKVEHQEWWFDYSIDTESCLTHLFFLHKTSLNLLRKFPEVIIMDCTYNTNRFKMPLLHMVGCTNINFTFEVGYVFMSRETEGDYQWALDTFTKVLQENSIQEPGVIVTDRELALMNAIDQKFPSSKNILCAWHIKMALQTHLGKELDTDSVKDFMKDFMKVWNAPTSVEFSKNWSSCKAKWLATNDNGGRIVKYMEGTWLPYAERFVICFVNRYLRLGHLTSGKAEGVHHYLKMFIAESTGHLFTVVKRIQIALGQQYQRYLDLLHQQQVKGIMQGSFFRDVNTLICRHALKLVETQLVYLEKHQAKFRSFGIPIPECNCNFTLSLGVPCYHSLKGMLEKYEKLRPDDFHRHWHLAPVNLMPPQQDDPDGSRSRVGQECLAGNQNASGDIPNSYQSRKHTMEVVQEPVAKRSRRMSLAANLNPANAVVNEVVNSTLRCTSHHEDGITINIEDEDLVQSAAITNSPSESLISTRRQRLCSGCGQPGHTFRTCGRRRVRVISN